jgi:hypothetical protein
MFSSGLEYHDGLDSLLVRHCLALPVQSTCKVGVSNTLLLVVIFSILVKALQGSIVVWKLPSASLVTPGDAIQSFILNPDPHTKGLATLDIVDSERLEVRLMICPVFRGE